jgi:hypothetical protein
MSNKNYFEHCKAVNLHFRRASEMSTVRKINNTSSPLRPVAFISTVLLISLFGAGLGSPALAQESFVTVLDDQGPDQLDQANDPGGSQQDITGARLGNQGSFGWAWDETDLSGNNSIDTCTYFEEPDGTVTSVCYSVQFEPDGSITSGFPVYEVYDCGSTYDGAQQKCTGFNQLSTQYTATCGDPAVVPSYFGPPDFPVDDQPDLQADCKSFAVVELERLPVLRRSRVPPTLEGLALRRYSHAS